MEQTRLSFYDEIRNNKIYSVLLIFIVFVILIALGYAISFAFSPDYFFTIMTLSIIISILYIWIGYYNSASIAIASVGAVQADPKEYKMLYDLVEGLTLASGLPMPKLYIMKNDQINAFASGRDPKNAVICVTTGTLEKLSKQELEGVLSHELSHIANFDIRFMTLTAVLVGMIAIISELFLRSLWYGSRSRDSDNKGNAIFLVIGIVLAILAPILVQLVQLAISSRREFVADANAVKFTRTPTGLIQALEKIRGNKDMKVSGAVTPLFLAKPNHVSNLFETHPPLEVRIEKLRRM